jgi:hypothetical protein
VLPYLGPEIIEVLLDAYRPREVANSREASAASDEGGILGGLLSAIAAWTRRIGCRQQVPVRNADPAATSSGEFAPVLLVMRIGNTHLD